MTTDINFNASPYFDDFDETKGFQRILFKPSVAVQARELTQLQTILQKQIENFGKHIFQNGTLVYGGSFDVEDSIDYIEIEVFSSQEAESLIGKTIVGQTNQLKAFVSHAILDDENFNTAILYVRYLNSSEPSSVFLRGEIFSVEETFETYIIKEDEQSVGKGSLFGITEGVTFVQGFFVKFDALKIPLEKRKTDPSRRIYFKSNFSIVDSNEDITLLDNANGFNNFSAPGADRLKCEMTLVSVPLDVYIEDENHSILFEVDRGLIRTRKERTEYSKVMDELAKRTFDESGDYVVRGFTAYSREHLNTGSNGGRLTLDEGGNSDLISIGIESGLGYVKGYEVNTLLTRYVDIPKSTDFVDVNNQFSFVRSGNYVEVNEFRGLPEIDSGAIVELYNASGERSTLGLPYDNPVSGIKIGEARINSILHDRGEFGDPKAVFRLYLFDIKMNPGHVFSEVRGFRTNNFFADAVVENDQAVLRDIITQNRLYYVGSDHVKNIKDKDGETDTSFIFYRRTNATSNTTGNFSISVVTSNEGHPYGTGVLQSLAKQSLFIQIDENVNITLPGTVSGVQSGTTLTGAGTSFTRLNVGDKLQFDGNIHVIDQIINDTEIVLRTAIPDTITNIAFSKAFIKGDIIDMNGKGSVDGTIRSVEATSSNTLVFNMKENFGASVQISVVHQVFRSSANQINKVIRPNRMIKVDCSDHPDLSKLYLGVSDVFRIKKVVRKEDTPVENINDGVDVTSSFTLHTGQTETSYETSWVETTLPLQPEDHLLIVFDYFEPDFSTGFGYFSIDSYPIDDTQESETTIFTADIPRFRSPATGSFNLRNHIDTRVIFQPSVSMTTDVSLAPVNPPKSFQIAVQPNGMRNPVPGTNFVYDYSYYLARRDVIVVDRDGDFSAIQGQPEVNPLFPSIPSNYMGIANVFVPPYPTIAETFGRILGRKEEAVQSYSIHHARHTMRDIGVLKKRIKNLEYYNALSLLEASTLDLTIPDENGLDRFKNGVFVDIFTDHSLGDTNDPDYRVAVDREEKVIRPVFDIDGLDFDYAGGDTDKTGNLVHAPYTEIPLIIQPNATTIRNIEQSVFRFIGTLEVTPSVDTWVDTTTADKIIEYGDRIAPEDLIVTEWGSWNTYSTGATSGNKSTGTFKAYIREFGDRSGDINKAQYIGTFRTQSEAQAAIRNAGTLNHRSPAGRGIIVSEGGEIVTTNVTERSGIETTTIVQDEFTDLGNFVTSVDIIPYIRPQSIRLLARGLKANTRFWVFFDGENMTQNCIPVEISESGDYSDLSGIQQKGMQLRSNEFGELLCFLVLPTTGKQFRVGTKDIIITDSPTNAVDATTYAEDTFVASGLSIQYQNTILSTQNIVGTETRTLNERFTTTGTTRTKQSVQIFGPSCMAYSFFVDLPEEVPGVYLTSVDIFVKSMHPTLGMWFEIREMDNSGGITRKQVPFSEVWMRRDDPRINLTDDASTPTRVNFEAPVFLFNDRQYAFVIHTEGLNPDTYFWVSRLGETDIRTNRTVTGRQLTGTTFTTNNNLNWDIVPDVDLTCQFNVADFSLQENLVSVFENKDYEFIDEWEEDVESGVFDEPDPGEPVESSDILTLDDVSGFDTDFTIIGQTSGKTAKVKKIEGNKIFTDGFDFEENETLQVLNASNVLVSGLNPNIVSIERALSRIRSYTDRTQSLKKTITNALATSSKTMTMEESNGMFVNGARVRSVLPNRNMRFRLTALGSRPFTALNFRPGFVSHSKFSKLKFIWRSIVKGANNFSSFRTIQNHDDVELDEVHEILSKSIERAEFGGQKSFRLESQLTTSNRFLSPVLDEQLMNAVFVFNLVNDDLTDEELPSGGLLKGKYISRTITLAEGQDAEDLRIFLKEYRPPGCDVEVFFRARNKYDPQPLNEKGWVKMIPNKERFSSISNRFDFIDATYSIPSELMTGQFGEYEYVSDGNTFSGYKQFQVKIGLTGINPARYSRAGQLRAIALQM